MLSLLQKCCAYVFPERPDHQLVRTASVEDFLSLLNPTVRDDFVFLLDFKEPLVRAAVHEAKFHGNEKAWGLLAAALASYLRHQPSRTALLPIPLSAKRERKRGYNQVHEVAKRALKEVLHIKIETTLLHRQRDTIPQTKLARKARLKNVEGAFAVALKKDLEGITIIVLDDVATTGATLKAARVALTTGHPTTITLLALAH